MFYEKDKSGNCYKSFAKWDLPYDREESVHEIILKRRLEDSTTDSKYAKAGRDYLWTRLAETIFKEDAINFYSTQMRKYFLPPDIRMGLTRKREDHEFEGIGSRITVAITD